MSHWTAATCSAAAALTLPLFALATAQDEAIAPVDFARDVRPILSDHCFACHGPDEAQRKARLRLDAREHVFADRGDWSLIAPGDVDASELLTRVFDEFDPMPPEGEGEPLTEAEKELLLRWVLEGAAWPEDHWAFEPPVRPAPPTVGDEDWVRDDLDRFVLARLEAAELEPAAEADRAAWLRRASFDLTGLPPSPEELDEFLANSEDDAFEREADRLLASPRFGERQAQEWLDLARYADSSGNQFDTPRTNWKWRDWVIAAFNDNQPFDDFTVEQLAGDLLPNPTTEQLVATGFNRNHQTDEDNPSEPDEYRTEYVLDRVHTTATTWMGLTMSCAQCHDHKYDPISQKDFYSFYSFFNNVAERDIDFGTARPTMRVPNPDQAPLLVELEAQVAALEARLEAEDPLFDAEQRRWENETLAALGEPVEWTTLEPVGMLSRNGAWLRTEDDGSVVASGPVPTNDTYDLVIAPGPMQVEALRLEVLPDDSRDDRASGRSEDGTFRLASLEIRSASYNDGDEVDLIYTAFAGADLVQELPRDVDSNQDTRQPGRFESAIAYEREEDQGPGQGGGFMFRGGGRGWSIIGSERSEPHEGIVIPIEPLTMNDTSLLKIRMVQQGGESAQRLIARFRWSVTDDPRVRQRHLPMAPKLWSSLGPYPAESAVEAFVKAFPPEEDFADGEVDRKARYAKPAPPEKKGEGEGMAGEPAPDGKPEGAAGEGPAPAERAEAGGRPTRREPERVDRPAVDEPMADRRRFERDEPAAQERAEGAAAIPEGEEPDGAKPGDRAAAPKPDAAAAPAEAGAEPAAPMAGGRRDRGPQELTWEEQKTWRDGQRAKLEVESGAYYLTREIHCERPGTATLRLDGPAGVRVWLNGEVVFEDAPEPPAAGPPAAAAEPQEVEFGELDFEALAKLFGGGGGDPREVRLGFREGVNELVVKAVFQAPPKREGGGRQASGAAAAFGGFGMMARGGGGASVTFDFTPQGKDILDYAVVAALQTEAREAASVDLAADEVDLGADYLEEADDLELVKAIQAAPSELTGSDLRRSFLREHFRENVSPVGRALGAELERVREELGELEAEIPKTMVMAEREEPRQAYVFIRGDWRQRGEDVDTATPPALPPMADDLPRDRLGLARWLVSGEHPLTARVRVNQIWQQYFGTGLVDTPEDFGLRSSLPTHPQLLDWLAVEFVDSGWDQKALHRRIVLSSTYRQAAVTTPDKLEADPENRLLSRGPRLRLTAEMVRDNALFVSGLLVEKLGGPSVRPYQAEGVWSEVTGGRDWRTDKGEKLYRRGLYVYWKRRVPYPSMVAFDASKGESCTVQRPTTNTPLQALVLLNNPAYVEAAKLLGQRLLAEGGDDDAERLALGFRLCTSRPPTEQELEILTAALTEQRAAFAEDAEGAKKLLSVGETAVDEEHDARELAAWTSVASVLLNLDATIHRG